MPESKAKDMNNSCRPLCYNVTLQVEPVMLVITVYQNYNDHGKKHASARARAHTHTVVKLYLNYLLLPLWCNRNVNKHYIRHVLQHHEPAVLDYSTVSL